MPIPTYPELSQSVSVFIRTVLSYLFFNGPVLSAHHQLPPFPSFSFTTLRPCVARAVRQESRALRKMLQGPRLRTILLSSLVNICQLQFAFNLPIQLVKIATGCRLMLLGSFHPKRLVFRHVRVHLRWIPLDDPISFHIAVATLVAVNSFVHVGSPVSGGIRRKRSKVLRSPLRDGIGWTQGKACHVMATNEPSAPSAPAPAQVCSHFVHMAQIAGSPNFQLGSQSCIEIWTCWRPSGHHLDTISTYLHYLSFQNQERSP